MEETGFEGVVTHLSRGLHRHDVDTVTVQLQAWNSPDASFKGRHYLHKVNDNTLHLFISYSESIWGPNRIERGDRIKKEPFSFDFSIYNRQQQLKKNLSLLFCSYENPDSIIRKDSFIFGMYGSYFNEWDTLFSGTLTNGKRNGSWRYYQAYENPYKILEGQYHEDKRNGKFVKYYQRMKQLIYEENYVDNLPDGPFTWWYTNGQVESKRFFDHGRPCGVWEFYDNKGKLSRKENYEQ
jgi:hypothetical protein